MLDAQAPNTRGGSKDNRGKAHWDPATHRDSVRRDVFTAYPDSGGASRFFFLADYDEGEVPENRYPHMCQDGHPRIGHSTEGERCPVCVERDRAEQAEAELE